MLFHLHSHALPLLAKKSTRPRVSSLLESATETPSTDEHTAETIVHKYITGPPFTYFPLLLSPT